MMGGTSGVNAGRFSLSVSRSGRLPRSARSMFSQATSVESAAIAQVARSAPRPRGRADVRGREPDGGKRSNMRDVRAETGVPAIGMHRLQAVARGLNRSEEHTSEL